MGKVAIYLVKNGPMPLGKILQECDMKVDEVNNRWHWLVVLVLLVLHCTLPVDTVHISLSAQIKMIDSD